MTNLAAIVTILITTNNVVHLLPSGEERYVQPVVTTAHIYSVTNNLFTNVVSVVSNEPFRMVWRPEPISKSALTLTDKPPLPPGLESATTATNAIERTKL